MAPDQDEVEPRDGRREHRLEIVATVILALGSTMTAWSAFQSSKWSGLQAIAFSRAGAARTESTQAATRAGQQSLLDVVLFVDWVTALNDERRGLDPRTARAYEPDPATLSGFLYQRFRPEFQPAVDAWIAQRPLVNPNAPATPFLMPEYESAERARAERLHAEAEARTTEALENNARSDRYVLTTVILAVGLFFAGVSMKLESFSIRTAMTIVAGGLLVIATGLLISYPVAL